MANTFQSDLKKSGYKLSQVMEAYAGRDPGPRLLMPRVDPISMEQLCASYKQHMDDALREATSAAFPEMFATPADPGGGD